MPDTIATDRAIDRNYRIGAAIEEAVAAAADKLDILIDTLDWQDCVPRAWAGSAERNELCKRAARLAVLEVLAEANLPAETQAIYCESGWAR